MQGFLASLARSPALAGALIVAAMVACGVATRDWEILGMDSYPAIVSGLLRGPGDVVAIFTSPAVPGRVPYMFHGFYRPLTTFSLGLDHALYGVEPRGYFVTQALLFGACALALYVVARRLLGAAALAGPLAALVVFVLAPSQVETLAVVARRSELLCGLFSLLAIATQVSRVDRGFRWALLPAAFTLLAVVSKTTGIAVVPAIFVLALLRTPRTGLGARLGEGFAATAPHAAAVVAAFAVQIAILGQVGGHIFSRASGGIDRLPWALGGLAGWLFVPQPGLRGSPLTWILLAVLGAALATTIVLLARDRREAATVVAPLGATAALGATWLLGLASLYGAVGLLQGWYVFVPSIAYALLVGVLVEGLARAARSDAAPLRAAAVATLVLVATWIGWQARYSMLVGSYTRIVRASTLTRTYLDDLGARIAAAPDGGTVLAPPPPRKLPPRPDEWTLDGPILLPEYALQSWAECAFPERRIVVHDRQRRAIPEAPPDALEIFFRG